MSHPSIAEVVVRIEDSAPWQDMLRLLQAYRDLRNVDGRHGRPWDGSRAKEADDAITRLESSFSAQSRKRRGPDRVTASDAVVTQDATAEGVGDQMESADPSARVAGMAEGADGRAVSQMTRTKQFDPDPTRQLLADWREQDEALQAIWGELGIDQHAPPCPAEIARQVKLALMELRRHITKGVGA